MKNWLKVVTVLILVYVHIGGLLFDLPRLYILNETIRGLYFHTPMWFTMILLYSLSLYYAIRYLANPMFRYDARSVEFAHTGTAFGVLGMITGMIWGKYTWGAAWSNDPKQVGAAVALLVYLAYFVLRGSLDNEQQRARLGAVYNIFAYAAMIPLIFIIPRMTSSIHPGSGGNPGFNAYDLDSRMRMVFYPAVIGWCMLGYWISSLRFRLRILNEELISRES